jgi:hypothetical protein
MQRHREGLARLGVGLGFAVDVPRALLGIDESSARA